jgi:RNA polymerase subunit RPABC4/transcription elongation factor Spt4
MSEDHCVCCGAVIPEGKWICPKCEREPGLTEESFSDWLQIQMDKQHLSKAGLARKAKVTPETVLHYLYCDRQPTFRCLNKILDALGKKLVIVDKEEKHGK